GFARGRHLRRRRTTAARRPAVGHCTVRAAAGATAAKAAVSTTASVAAAAASVTAAPAASATATSSMAVEVMRLFESNPWPRLWLFPRHGIPAAQGHYQDHAVHDTHLMS